MVRFRFRFWLSSPRIAASSRGQAEKEIETTPQPKMKPSKTAGIFTEERIKTLPQELQDMIFDFTIASVFQPGTVVAVGQSLWNGLWRPPVPALLRINRSSRAKAAELYYSSLILDCTALSTNLFVDWLQILPREHVVLMQNIRIDMTRPKLVVENDHLTPCWARAWVNVYRRAVRKAKIQLPGHALHAKAVVPGKGAEARREEWLDAKELTKLIENYW